MYHSRDQSAIKVTWVTYVVENKRSRTSVATAMVQTLSIRILHIILFHVTSVSVTHLEGSHSSTENLNLDL